MFSQSKIIHDTKEAQHFTQSGSIDMQHKFQAVLLSFYVCPCIFNKDTNILHSLLHGNLMCWFCQHKFLTLISKKFWNSFTIAKHFTGKPGFL